jgi:hypothetical protein
MPFSSINVYFGCKGTKLFLSLQLFASFVRQTDKVKPKKEKEYEDLFVIIVVGSVTFSKWM